MKISVVSPVYMAQGMVQSLSSRLATAIEPLGCQYEIILVNDASPDMSWQEIKECCQANRNIKGISLSRNFGQHQAIAAGLSMAQGDYTVVMDCDLQDRPEEIPALLAKAQEGYDIVLASRAHRKDGLTKRLPSSMFHWLMGKIDGCSHDGSVANFGIYSRRVIEQYNLMPETTKLLGPQISHLGFRRATIPVEHQARQSGKSSYTARRLASLATGAIIATSNRPLKWAAAMGLAMTAISLALAIYTLAARLCGATTLPGYTPSVFSIWFVGGLILTTLGVIGLYIGKIFDQVKGRQPYIIMETANIETQQN